MPYLYFEGNDAAQLAQQFLVAPDFAATIANHLVARSAISVHPHTWSRIAPDRKFFEVWGATEAPGDKFIADLKSLNSQLSHPLFSKFETYQTFEGKFQKITWTNADPMSWKWMIQNCDELKHIFLNTPFFYLRLGYVQTDSTFIDADLGFIWPEASLAHNAEFSEFTFQNEKGLLGSMGYRVGEQAAPESERRAILTRVFQAHQLNFPKELPDHYKNGWGLAGSAPRLRKIADSISFFSKAFIGRNGEDYLAVTHWRSDMAWLKQEFYDGNFSFEWAEKQTNDEQVMQAAKAFQKVKPERYAWIMNNLEGKERQDVFFNDLIQFIENEYQK